MQYIGSLEAAEKHISTKIFKENLHTSVKILQICIDLQDSMQRSLQNPAEKILQICTDSQRLKTWVHLIGSLIKFYRISEVLMHGRFF